MDKEKLVGSWLHQLREVFELAKVGTPSDKKKYRTEGFLHAMRLSGIVCDDEINQLIEALHYDVFGESVRDRKQKKAALNALKQTDQDAYYAIPAIERN